MKTIIVGGGGAGLASALLSSLREESVELYEAHENLGGCASWFKRKDYIFDVGATTLSGLDPSEPLGKFFGLLQSFPRVRQVDPGMVIHLSSGKRVHYYSDFSHWMEELSKAFPDLEHVAFWEKVYSVNKQGWELLESLSGFPFKKADDFLRLLNHPTKLRTFPYLLVSTELMLKWYGLYRADYLELINGILLISAQGESADLPFLVGAMGLAYPSRTYAPEGGMKGFMDYLEGECIDRGIKIHKNMRIKSLEAFKRDKVILNLTIWDVEKLLKLNNSEKREAWGAFTIYFGSQIQEKNLYHQVHLNHPMVKNYFVSFSAFDDRSRAPDGHQAVTISTHVDALFWFSLGFADYKAIKTKIRDIIMDDVKTRFPFSGIHYLTAGTPRSFEHYTHRHAGFVGGLPFLYGQNPWRLNGHQTPKRNVFQVGDTTFPGQGLVGVVAGALALDEEIRRGL